MEPDVIVVGAGAAGLACMRDLERGGLRVLCLEARDRTGGRIHTVHDGYPMELGAEFVHGRPREIFEIADAAGLHVDEMSGRMLYAVDGNTFQAEEEGGPVMDDLKQQASAEHDESLLQFLDRSQYSDDQKQEAIGYAEGFNAACKEELSVASLAKEMLAADEIEGHSTFRVREGYDALVRAIAQGEIRLRSVVESIAWWPGECRVRLASGEERRAARVVVTVPLGVLQAGTIRFDPEPPGILEAARALRFGQAVRVTLRFERAFWEELAAFSDLGFLFSDQPVFPVWWSRRPWRDPVLTAWSAGSKADPLLGLGKGDIVSRALESLERILGTRPAAVTGTWFHDWHADPFSRGAYSWVPAGALPARDTLARPVADTLYFAGEATDLLGYGGTVHGAIASGRRAARQIIGD